MISADLLRSITTKAFGTEMIVLTFLTLFHVTQSYVYHDITKLVDFDEVNPFYDIGLKPDTIKDFELKRLPRRAGDESLTNTEVLMSDNEADNLQAADYDDLENREQNDSKGLVFQNLEKSSASPSSKNPFLNSKNYMEESNRFRSPNSLIDINVSFKIIARPVATPYTKTRWEPNFLRNVIDIEH